MLLLQECCIYSKAQYLIKINVATFKLTAEDFVFANICADDSFFVVKKKVRFF